MSAPATGGVQPDDCRIPALPATRAIYESDGWIKLHPCSLRLPPVQLTELIFKLLVFAPALGAVYQVNFKSVGVCACGVFSPAPLRIYSELDLHDEAGVEAGASGGGSLPLAPKA